MENHPIPQDVTGFKFKLIGSVTVKQFLYILGGGILAVICFVLPISAFIRIPLAAFFGGIGVLLAFVPIEGRPMDVMAKNFLKALPSENQYIYKKRGAEALITEFFSPKLVANINANKPVENTIDTKRALLYGALKKTYRPDEKDSEVLSKINSYLNDSTQLPTNTSVINADQAPPGPSLTQIVMPPTSQRDILDGVKVVMPTTVETEEGRAKGFKEDVMPTFETTGLKPLSFENETPKEEIPQTQNTIHYKIEPIKVAPKAAPLAKTVLPNESKNVTTISQGMTLKAGFPQIPDIPNVILGIVKDPRGKILTNILVEIMDMQGTPVRTFKTNALGQFAAATPLPDGEYNILLDDPRRLNEFEKIHIKLDGKIFEPLEIVSIDQREKLRRELFGGAGATPITA